MKLIAMVGFHNEARYLPRWLENVTPHVDGIVALDDRSTDGSAEILAGHPSLLALERIEPSEGRTWDESLNHRRLVEMAVAAGGEWALGMDPDERLERDFRARAEPWIAWAQRRRHRALAVACKELWDSPSTYRCDGYWDRKRKAVLFSLRGPLRFDERPLHGSWAPHKPRWRGLSRRARSHPQADLLLYHCRMIDREERLARREKYRALDPDARWNPPGYDYLVDETGLELRELPPGREYLPPEP